MATPASPAPHRPSRRAQIVEAAMRLHARQDGEPVTVAEIAREAYMTTPAIYYHYPSKDAVLLDGLRGFSADLADVVVAACEAVVRSGTIDELISSVIRWLDDRRHEAIVWYLTAPQTINTDELRRDQAGRTLPALRAAVRAARTHARPSTDGDTATAIDVIVVALNSLLEISVQSWLTEDHVRRELGPKRFLAEVNELTSLLTLGDLTSV